MFWSCLTLEKYWKSYFRVISDILGQEIELCPLTAIFGVPGVKPLMKQRNIVSFTVPYVLLNLEPSTSIFRIMAAGHHVISAAGEGLDRDKY